MHCVPSFVWVYLGRPNASLLFFSSLTLNTLLSLTWSTQTSILTNRKELTQGIVLHSIECEESPNTFALHYDRKSRVTQPQDWSKNLAYMNANGIQPFLLIKSVSALQTTYSGSFFCGHLSCAFLDDLSASLAFMQQTPIAQFSHIITIII